jgi:hypothetical protein
MATKRNGDCFDQERLKREQQNLQGILDYKFIQNRGIPKKTATLKAIEPHTQLNLKLVQPSSNDQIVSGAIRYLDEYNLQSDLEPVPTYEFPKMEKPKT